NPGLLSTLPDRAGGAPRARANACDATRSPCSSSQPMTSALRPFRRRFCIFRENFSASHSARVAGRRADEKCSERAEGRRQTAHDDPKVLFLAARLPGRARVFSAARARAGAAPVLRLPQLKLRERNPQCRRSGRLEELVVEDTSEE